MSKLDNMKLDTLLVQGIKYKASDPITPPIVTATTFRQNNLAQHPEFYYSRCSNPTRSTYEELLAYLENGTFAVATASGSAATSLALDLLPAKSHIIAHKNTYAGTIRIFEKIKKNNSSFRISYLDLNNTEELQQTISNDTAMIWIETPTNPLLEIIDLSKVISIAREHMLLTCVDNTLATAWNQKPLDFGADISVFSTSKYINGHSDITGGAVVVRNAELAEKLDFLKTATGGIASPFDAYLALRGLKTFSLRMERHCSNAAKIASRLANHPDILEIYYPELTSHTNHILALQQMKTGGGIVSIRINPRKVESFLSKLHYFILAESFGGVESIINHSATMSHGHIDKIIREAAGIYDETFRLSPGIEDPEDLINDLIHALD